MPQGIAGGTVWSLGVLAQVWRSWNNRLLPGFNLQGRKGGLCFLGKWDFSLGKQTDVGQFEVSGSKERFSWDLNVASKQYFFTGCTATVCLETCVSV